MSECLIANASVSIEAFITFSDPLWSGGPAAAPGCPNIPTGSAPIDLLPPPYNATPSTVWQPGAPLPFGTVRLTLTGNLSFGFEWSYSVPFTQHQLQRAGGGAELIGWDKWEEWSSASLESRPLIYSNPIALLDLGNAFAGNAPVGRHVSVDFGLGLPRVVLTPGVLEGGPNLPQSFTTLVLGGNPAPGYVGPTSLNASQLTSLGPIVSGAFGTAMNSTLGSVANALSGQFPNWPQGDIEDMGLVPQSGTLRYGMNPALANALSNSAPLPLPLLLAFYIQDPPGGTAAEHATGPESALAFDHEACLATVPPTPFSECPPEDQLVQVMVYQSLFRHLGIIQWGWPTRQGAQRLLFSGACQTLSAETPGTCDQARLQSFHEAGAWLLDPIGTSGSWVPGVP